jgi:hypothetical protein
MLDYEQKIKSDLAYIAGISEYNLNDYTIYQLIKEVEKQRRDYIEYQSGICMHPVVQEAYIFLSNMEQRN